MSLFEVLLSFCVHSYLSTALVCIFAFLAARYVFNKLFVNSSQWTTSGVAAGVLAPPQPSLTIPFIGYLPAVWKGGISDKEIQELAHKLGPVYSIRTGARCLVVVNDAKLVRQTLKSRELAGRAPTYKARFSNPNSDGIVDGSYTDEWKVLHDFTARVLKQSFSSSNQLLLNLVVQEAFQLAYFIVHRVPPGLPLPHGEAEKNSVSIPPIDPDQITISAMCNIVMKVLVGVRYDYNVEENQILITLLRKSFQTLVSGREYDMFPIWQQIYPQSAQLKQHEQVYQNVNRYMANHVARVSTELDKKLITQQLSESHPQENVHTQSYEEHQPTSFAEAFLLKQKSFAPSPSSIKSPTTTTSEAKMFTDSHLIHTLFDFLAAAAQTTSSAVRWSLLQLASDEPLQNKMRNYIAEGVSLTEIRNVLPSWAAAAAAHNNNETPSDVFADPHIPERLLKIALSAPIQAFFNEILRKYTVTPVGLPHYSMQAFVLQTENDEEKKQQKFVVPKNADLLTNMWFVHHDPKYWQSPDNFDMHRFLEPTTATTTTNDTSCFGSVKLRRQEAFVPFGLGPRMCMGEHLARIEFGLFFVILFSVFHVEFDDDNVRASGEWQDGLFNITHDPKSWKIKFRTL